MPVIFKTVCVSALAILFAAAGINHSPASSQNGTPQSSKPRDTVATSLGFANPLITDVKGNYHDLGDALIGSDIQCLIRAQNGVAPYSYTLTANAASVTSAGLELYANGILKNSADQSTQSAQLGALQFNVRTSDASGSTPKTADELFQINFTDDANFRFANDRLCDGTRFREYADALRVINGDDTVVFSISNITLNGNALSKLETIGLSLSKDGNLFGVPLKSGTLAFTATAEMGGNLAAGRADGTGSAQDFSLTIAANTVLSNTLISNPISLSVGTAGKDSLSLKAVANLNNIAISSLTGKTMSLRLGSYVSPEAVFDAKGVASFSNNDLKVSGSVKNGGLITFAISNATIDVGKISGATKTMGLELRIGDAVLGTEFLNFALTTGKGTLRKLDYKGAFEDDWGGGFQVLTGLGTDDAKKTGDSWRTSFLLVPPRLADIDPTTLNSLDLSLGSFAFPSMTLKNTSGRLSGHIGSALFNSDLSLTGKGTFNTPLVWAADSKISTASASNPSGSLLGMTLNFKTGSTVQFGAQGGLNIYPLRTMWNNTKPMP